MLNKYDLASVGLLDVYGTSRKKDLLCKYAYGVLFIGICLPEGKNWQILAHVLRIRGTLREAEFDGECLGHGSENLAPWSRV